MSWGNWAWARGSARPSTSERVDTGVVTFGRGAAANPLAVLGRRPRGEADVSDGLNIDLRRPVEPERPEHPNPVVRFWDGLWDILKSWGPPLFAVFAIRSIVVEPFQIPSGSMVPTLAIGDFIVVSKFEYGLRVPFTNIEILPLGEPERGDIDVFIYPPSVSEDPWCWLKRLPRGLTFDMLPLPGPDACSIDYIKRIVGLPGEPIEVRDDVVYIDGKEQKRVSTGEYAYTDIRSCDAQPMRSYNELLGDVEHPVLQSNESWQRMRDLPPTVVPEGHYFVMGDNRDNSADSRVWGFVPRDYIRGKAMFVWLSFDPCKPGTPGLGEMRSERIGQGLQ